MGGVCQVLGIVSRPSPSMAATGVMLLMMWVGHDFVALMVLAGEEFLQCKDTSDKEGDLGKKDGLGGGEGDDAEEEGDERHDLELGDREEWNQLLDLLLLATGWKNIEFLVYLSLTYRSQFHLR